MTRIVILMITTARVWIGSKYGKRELNWTGQAECSVNGVGAMVYTTILN